MLPTFLLLLMWSTASTCVTSYASYTYVTYLCFYLCCCFRIPQTEERKREQEREREREREREGHWSDKQGEIVRSAHTLSYMHLWVEMKVMERERCLRLIKGRIFLKFLLVSKMAGASRLRKGEWTGLKPSSSWLNLNVHILIIWMAARTEYVGERIKILTSGWCYRTFFRGILYNVGRFPSKLKQQE